MNHTYDLNRFTQAHRMMYADALREIKNGRKSSHWMWYIFPQLKGLGKSDTSMYYGLLSGEEAKAFMADPYLGTNLIEICRALLQLTETDPRVIMGKPVDARKLQSSMTLFQYVCQEETVFTEVLEKFFDGKTDRRTIRMLERMQNGL